MQKPIYLDYNSTTPTDPRVVEAMLPYFLTEYGNPSNTLHPYGWAAQNAVTQASHQVAELIHCKPNEIIWNAGATEGNNSVIFGLIRHLKNESPNEPIHMITSNAEHWSVLNSMSSAQKYTGLDYSKAKINSEGIVTLEEIKKHIRPETRLISLIWVNNEIGSINPIQEIAEYCQQQNIYLHTDATQAIGKIPVNLKLTPIHFLTFSAHKFYGPKGVGCLYIRSQNPYIEIEPFIVGGGQQNNRRSGTLNVPGIVGTGVAAELCRLEFEKDYENAKKLQIVFWQKLKNELPDVQINGPKISEKNDIAYTGKRSVYNLSLQMPEMIDLLLPKLTQIAFSQGSACQTGEASISHVLKALGLSPLQAQCTIRLSIGRFTQQTEVEFALKIIILAFKPKFLTAKL